MKPNLATVLSLNGGYVDTAGFLALQGLFTAHVTGNFVTLGAAVVYGTSGATAKLLALPMFCCVVIASRLLGYGLTHLQLPVLRTLLSIKLLLLIAGAFLAISFGPFLDGNGWTALITGMALVSAMGIQNAVHRIQLASAPPTTLMTGTTTQIMIDLADTIHGIDPEKAGEIRARLARMSIAVAAFAIGCAAAALLYWLVNYWCFAIPPIFGLLALIVGEPAKDGAK